MNARKKARKSLCETKTHHIAIGEFGKIFRGARYRHDIFPP